MMKDAVWSGLTGRGGLLNFRAKFPEKPLFESECCSCNTQRGENTCKGAGCFGSVDRDAGVQQSFNADCLAAQTNASQGVPWVAGSMVWTVSALSCLLLVVVLAVLAVVVVVVLVVVLVLLILTVHRAFRSRAAV